MKEDNKIYMNQIRHKIFIEEKKIIDIKEKRKSKSITKVLYGLLSILLFFCLLLKPEILEGFSIYIGFIILSLVTFYEYKELNGGLYEL